MTTRTPHAVGATNGLGGPPTPPHPAEAGVLPPGGGAGRAGLDVTSRAVPGGEFLLDQPTAPPSIWGEGLNVAWPRGEPFYLAGAIGSGKTTLGAQVGLARAGVRPGPVLGLPVADDGGRVLWLAMDRPAQIARAVGRLVAPEDRAKLDDRVTFWRGPLPFHLPDTPDALAEMAAAHKATTLIVDSVKDLAPAVEKPEVAWAVNNAFQTCVAGGVEVAAYHHQRKATGDNRKPTKLADMYGGVWLGAGAGSVLLLWGEPGDPVVELSHLKPAAETLGPWTLLHDHDAGTTTVLEQVDPAAILRTASKGITARTLAQAISGKPDPSRPDVERARRKLDRLVGQGLADRQEADPLRGVHVLYLPSERLR